ncbi:hypothetical protein BFP72_00905 [Reichenbachiella sp. 5M10]|uniref:EcsC family protein n=1 Tax=Reichenbachiella sp. 5M10 TaxID=1889772 RepID=UPI000C41AA09|nr:EcsC family protein [Reichenbachiella sp. 5M10]PIB34086.1 hypothetical protein BFP72_00905 [Reichenbachiella sp. 5M10]
MTHREKINSELDAWRRRLETPPTSSYKTVKRIQRRINLFMPRSMHHLIAKIVKETTRAVLQGAQYTTPKREFTLQIHNAEEMIRESIWFYSSSAAAQGAITGLGGLVSSIADFPLWISLKMKMLFEIAGYYGFDTLCFKERLFILHIFQLAFSSQDRRVAALAHIENWSEVAQTLPDNLHAFDWERFQDEYRDNLDIVKIFQLIPGVGAVIGACVNQKLTYRLGKTAMNAYRIRLMKEDRLAIAN